MTSKIKYELYRCFDGDLDEKNQKLIENEKGLLLQLEATREFRHLALSEMLPGKARGCHAHQEKEEHLLILNGFVRIYLQALDNKEDTILIELKKGDKMVIYPGSYHAIEPITESCLIEYAPQAFNLNDYMPWPDWENQLRKIYHNNNAKHEE